MSLLLGKHTKRGLTLIELIIVVGLVVLLLGAVAMFVRPMRGVFMMNERMISYKEESKVVFELVEKRLRTTKYLAIYDYISGKFPNEGVSGQTMYYLYVENGVLKEASGSVGVTPTNAKNFIDPGIFDRNVIAVSFYVNDVTECSVGKSEPCMLNMDLDILDTSGNVLYEASTGFELVNMVLSDAKVYDVSHPTISYPQMLVFTKVGE